MKTNYMMKPTKVAHITASVDETTRTTATNRLCGKPALSFQ